MNTRSWEKEHAFAAYFYSREHPERFGVRVVADKLKKDYGKKYSKSTIGNMINAIENDLRGGGSQRCLRAIQGYSV